jgi:ribose transport system permease protein
MTPANPTLTRTLASLRGQAPAAALIVLCVFSALLSSRFLTQANITNVLLQASVLAVLTIGMTYVVICGGFDLSAGSVIALSGCVAASVMLELGIAAGAACGIAAGALVGLVNGLVVAALRVNPFIATLATMVLVRGVVLLMTESAPISGESGLPEAFVRFGVDRLLDVPYLVWTALALFMAFAWLLHATPYGTRLFATGGNRDAAYLSGIVVGRIVVSAYVWRGTLAGVAGVLLAARLQSGQPTAGEFYELTAIAAVVLGGAALHGGEGKLYKSMIGVLIITVLSNSLNLMNVGSYWQRIVIGLVLVAAAAADQLRARR